MSLRYPGYSPIPDYDNALEGVMEGMEIGDQKKKTFAAQQVLAGNTGAKQPNFLEQLAGAFTAPKAAPAPTGPTPTNATSPIGGSSYMAAVRTAESGGNDSARNPNSSATGRYQFLTSTWDGLMRQYPELELTPDGRTDAAQQERAMERFTRDNAGVLSSAGIAINPGNLYAAHFLGAGGASKALTADPSTPMGSLVDPGVIKANPHLANMTAADFSAWANAKGGNGSGGYSAPMPYDQPRTGTARQFAPEEIATLMASEETRPFALQLLQNEQQAGRYEVIEQPDGSIRQIDRMTGQTDILQQAPQPVKPPGPTALMQNLEAAGLVPGSQEYRDAVLKGTVSGVTVNTGDNSGAFNKKGDENAAERLGGIVESGQGAAQFMGDIQALTALGSQLNTGKTAEIMTALGPYAEAFGVPIADLGEAQAYQAIIDRMAPAMRPAGSGAASDFDARQFLSSLPNLGRNPEGNQIITDTLTALQQHKMAAAEIASSAFLPEDQGGITWQEAEKRIRELPNPYEGFNAYKGRLETTLPEGVTEEDIQYTMERHGISREEVLQRIGNAP